MNQEAINSAYEDFVKGGYNGTIQDFINLISTNPEALNDVYSDFTKTGYNGNINEFKELMGVGNQKSSTKSSSVEQKSESIDTGSQSEKSLLESYSNIFPKYEGVTVLPNTFAVYDGKSYTREEFGNTVKKLTKEKPEGFGDIVRSLSLSRTKIQNLKYYNEKIYDNYKAGISYDETIGDVAKIKTKSDIEAEKRGTEKVLNIPMQQGTKTVVKDDYDVVEEIKAKVPKITEGITKLDEDDAIEKLEALYEGYGVKFENAGNIFSDEIKVTITKGKHKGATKTYKIDAGAFEMSNKAKAQLINEWLRPKVVKIKDSLDSEIKKATKKLKSTKKSTDKETSDFFNRISVDGIDGSRRNTNLNIAIGEERQKKNVNIPVGAVDPITGAPIQVEVDGKKIIDNYDKNNSIKSGDQDVTNTTKKVIQDLAFEKYLEDKKIAGDLTAAKIAEIKNSSEFKKVVSSIEKELQKQVDEADGDYSKIPMYSQVVEKIEKNKRLKNLEKQITENLDESEGWRAFTATERQKALADKADDRLEDLKSTTTNTVAKIGQLNKDREKVLGYLKTIDNDLTKRKEEIENIIKGKYTTQEQVDAANYKIETLMMEFDEILASRQNLREKFDTYDSLQEQYFEDLRKIQGQEEDLTVLFNVARRNPGHVTAFFANLGNSVVDIAQGIVSAADMVWDGYEELAELLPEPYARLAKVVGMTATGGLGATFSDSMTNFTNEETGKKESLWDRANTSINDFQLEEVTNIIRKPQEFGEISSFGDALSWTSTLVANQLPQLALMYATGGTSLYFLGANSVGSKWEQLQSEKQMYYTSGGLYGQNHSKLSMYTNASLTGIGEVASERITLGAINRTKGFLRKPKYSSFVKPSYGKYLRKEVFTFSNAKAFSKDFLEEGTSEVFATLTSNGADIFISGNPNNINIYDGFAESFMSGGVVSGAISSPRLFKKLYKPFSSNAANTRRSEIGGRLLEIQNEIKTANAEKVQELENEYVKLVEESQQLLENDIKRIDVFDDSQKKELVEIDKQGETITNEINRVSQDTELNAEERVSKTQELQNKLYELNKRKNKIIESVSQEDIDKRYAQEVEALKAYQDEINRRGVVEMDVDETTTDGLKDKITEGITGRKYGDVIDFSMQLDGMKEGYQQILNDKNSTPDEKAEARAAIDQIETGSQDAETVLNIAEGNARNYGAFAPRFDNKGNVAGLDIVINKETSLENGMFKTAAHEFVHAAFYNTLKADPIAREKLGSAIDQLIDNGNIQFKNKTAEAVFNARIKGYDGSVKAEEKATIITEMVRNGDAIINQGGLKNLGGMFRRFGHNYLNNDIKLDTPQDVLNFIKDYDISVKNNKPNKAIIKMLEKGANGKMFEDARTPEQRKEELEFSRALNSNIKSNPDLKDTFDKRVQNPDGTPKYASQSDFAVTPDFTDAYFDIVEGRSLDALIQQGMTERGLPPEALREFTRKVKEEVGRRFLTNYSLDKNDSLFGWLTGTSGGAGRSIIYRAKGDVMNEYKRENRVEETSLDKPVGDAGTLSDVLLSERDSALDALDNMDLSPGRKKAARELINEVKVKEALDLDADTRQSLRDTIVNADLDITDLTYKDFKQLVAGVDKITRKDKSGNIIVNKKTGEPKLFNPTKTADASPSGALYNVLETLSAEFGIDPLRVLANQDLDAKQRRSAQEKILALSTNADGTFNDILFQLLPEGETRSGQATGIADTKLGDLYITGERLKVSEGASKKLGQKRSQTKIDSVEKDNFLGLFGITPDGTFETGTANDGAIRQLVTSLSQLAANQETRLNTITNGTATEAIRAKLADGKSQMAFSKNSEAQNVINAAFPEVVMQMSNDISTESIDKAIDNVVGNLLTDSQKTRLRNKIQSEVDGYLESKQILGETVTPTEAMLENFQRENFVDSLDDVFKNRDADGKKITVANTINSIDGVNKARRNLTITTSKLIDKKGIKKGVEMTIAHLSSAVSSMGKIGDGRFIPREDGGDIIENPNYIKGKGLKRIKDGETRYSKQNRYQITTGKLDFLALVNQGLPSGYSVISPKVGQYLLVNPDGSQTSLETTLPKENTEAFLKDIETKGAEQTYKDRLEVSKEAREVVEIAFDNAYDRLDKGEINRADIALMTNMLGSDMQSPLRRSANAEFIADNVMDIIKNRGKLSINKVTQYEHMKSKVQVSTEIVQSYDNNRRLDKKIFDDYQVQVISYNHNRLIDDSGLQTLPTMDGTSRSFNLRTMLQYLKNPNKYNISDIAPIRSINPKNKKVVGENWIKTTEALEQGNQSGQQMLGNIINSGYMFSKPAPKSRGMSAFDFDETLIIDGDNFIIATDPTTGKETRISSADWPIKGPELMAKGFDFNFDDFINVRGGVEGPLFQKLKNRIAKFGPQNNYILTARPQESAVAIHGWLKSKGINLPLENITGLGNSTGEAKAMWMAGKYAEGYNDMYFVDDALPNVEAVKDMMDQLDIKGSSVQARFNFSKEFDSSQFDNIVEDGMNDMKEDLDLDIILEETKGVAREKKFSKAKAIRRGKGKGRFKFFLPPSAEDFKGLIYSLLGKGKKGERHHKFFKDKLFDPYAKAMRALHMLKQSVSYDMRALKKANKDIAKKLNKDIPGLEFTLDQAVRVYNYTRNGFDIPGMSQTDINELVKHVESNPDVKAFADGVESINQKAGGLVAPDDAWLAENISIATNSAADNTRDNLLSEFNNNVDTIFSEENMNKLQAVYGPNYVEALKDVIYRMKSGSNRPEGMSRLMNGFMDWINGSVGATMFFNARSAVLQTLSTVNFINWSDNNPLKVAKTLANPKQFAIDFISLFNSDFLKQRRSGLQQDLNAKEMAEAIRNSKNPVRAVIGYILQKGFLPTQMADSFAIAMGGASFYRNRVNSYLEQGLNQKEAETKAFEDFQEIAEETQQSARPDKISQQQASPLGKLILAFQNTPMQYNRLIKRAMQDLVNGRGDAKTHVSKILYYGAIQNAIFYGLQQALFAVAFGDDEEEEKDNDDKYFNIGNGMIDSLLRGSGFAGAAVSTLKNMVLEFMEQEESKYQPDHAYTLIEMLNLSPPVGIKARKLYSATQSWEFNERVIKQMSLTQFDNPIYEAAFSATEAITNIPLSRLYSKVRNIREAMNSDNDTWQRVALFLGWSTWNFGIKPQAVIDAKQQVKEIQKEERKKKNEIKKQERKEKEEAENKVKIEENKKLQEEEKKEGKKVQCAAISRSGKRCRNEALPGKSFCTIHDEVEQGDKEVQCSHIKKDGKRCKMKTKNKSGLCYYHD